MQRLDAILFIDANQYLDLYQVIKGKILLTPLLKYKEYLFITEQIAQEVQRRKLQVAADFLATQFKQLEARSFEVPDHLFDISGETTAKLRQELKDVHARTKKLNKQMISAAVETLQRISESKDAVSAALDKIFERAFAATPQELQQARERKERGNPPGKTKDPLGDQLTWQQLLNHCATASELWIITKDYDYLVKQNSKLFLNAFLYKELIRNNSEIKIHCFDKLVEGINHFAKTAGLKIPLAPKVIEEIKEEQESLPPADWQRWYEIANYSKIPNPFLPIITSWPTGSGMSSSEYLAHVRNAGPTFVTPRWPRSEEDKNK